MITKSSSRRPGMATLEAAIVFPVFFFLIVGLVVGSRGVFIYQEVAYLSREATRYASVRGTDYAKASGQPAATASSIYDNAIKPRLMILDPAKLTYTVTWDKSNEPATTTTNVSVPKGNSVTVTVTYQWFPKMYLVGPYTLKSSSTLPMAY